MTDTLVVGLGDIGGPLAASLAQRGDRVWGLRRSQTPPPPGVLPIRADLNQSEQLRHLPPVQRVFYVVSASSYDEAGYRAAYVDGLNNLIQALADRPIERLLFVSSTSVYGQNNGQTVDEDSPTEPGGYRGRIMLEGEALLRRAPFPTTAVRFAGIYGPGRYYVIRAVAEGADWPPHVIGNRIHRDDCVRVLTFLSDLPEAPPCLLACDDDPAPMAQVGAWLRDRLRERGVTLGGNPPGRAMHGAKRCCNARLKALGFRFQVPSYRQGYLPLLDAWLAEKDRNT